MLREDVADLQDSWTDLLDLLARGYPPAFCTDSRQTITFWNWGAAQLLGREATEVLGRSCHDVLCGKDPHGNRFCYDRCPVMTTLTRGEAASGCELVVSTRNGDWRPLAVTILQLPDGRTGGFSVVHFLQPIRQTGTLAQALKASGAKPVTWSELRGRTLEPSRPVPNELTGREAEILSWVAQGLQNKEIADKLGISLATVRNHIHHILEKLDVHSKLEAVSLAFRSGWIDFTPASVGGPPAAEAAVRTMAFSRRFSRPH
jgi:DNA-binding CsgD family transcriptional regulator